VRQHRPDAVVVRRLVRRSSYRIDPAAGPETRPPARHRLWPYTLRVDLPDASALVRLAASGLLTGGIRGLTVRLRHVPDWLMTGLRPPRLGRSVAAFRWRHRRGGLVVRFHWHRPCDIHQALSGALAAVLRTRAWHQTSGPVVALTGTAPIITSVANPYGRTMIGAAEPYRLVPGVGLCQPDGRVVLRLDPAVSPEAAVQRGRFSKYAVVSVHPPLADDHFTTSTLRVLSACGLVFAATDPAVRGGLDALGVVTVADATEVDDLRGYALSVAAARHAIVTGDAVLRRSALAGDSVVPLPTVSVVLSSMRPECLEACLDYLSDQTYPALEVLVGLHGYDVPPATRAHWRDRLPIPLRVRTFPAELPFGAVLGQLSRNADGELLTKVDDDDHYGRHHVTDLVLAWHTSGADLVAKGARFVHLPERGETIDRAWAAPEVFDVTPAGGTVLLSRAALQQVGGWSHSPRHVDADLLQRLASAGGLVYRTHAMEYVYVRRSSGHTFATDTGRLLAHGERIYPGLPRAIIEPGTGPASGPGP
jgi:hypothetical protein